MSVLSFIYVLFLITYISVGSTVYNVFSIYFALSYIFYVGETFHQQVDVVNVYTTGLVGLICVFCELSFETISVL